MKSFAKSIPWIILGNVFYSLALKQLKKEHAQYRKAQEVVVS